MTDDRPRPTRTLLAILVTMSIIAALKATSTVIMPVALAVFVVIVAWPLQRWLERRHVPRALAYIFTLVAIVGAFTLFLGLLYLCGQSVAAKAGEYEERVNALYQQARSWIEEKGVTAGEGTGAEGEPPASTETIVRALHAAVVWSYGFLGLFTLTATFIVLGLVEVHRLREKVRERVTPRLAQKVREAGQEVGTTLRRYMLVRTVVSATTGILVGLFTWAIGLDFPLVWGVSSFLLNYIPVLGSIVAVIPPSLFALLHPEWWVFFAALGGLTVIQFTIGNFIDPRLEGRILALSPFVLFFSIVFWGWVWGIPGALMGIPITATVVIFCRKFEASRWVADLLVK